MRETVELYTRRPLRRVSRAVWYSSFLEPLDLVMSPGLGQVAVCAAFIQVAGSHILLSPHRPATLVQP
jgi:hypothetical protein